MYDSDCEFLLHTSACDIQLSEGRELRLLRSRPASCCRDGLPSRVYGELPTICTFVGIKRSRWASLLACGVLSATEMLFLDFVRST